MARTYARVGLVLLLSVVLVVVVSSARELQRRYNAPPAVDVPGDWTFTYGQ